MGRMRAMVAAMVVGTGCAGETPRPRGPAPSAPVPSDTAAPGHPGIQIGQTGTAYSCDVVPVDDPTVPADGFTFAAAEWWAALDLEHDAVFVPMDGGIGDVDGAAVAVTVDGAGSFGVAGGACSPHYVADAVVALQAGDLLTIEVDAAVAWEDASTASWSVEVPAALVGGTLGDPPLGALAEAPRVLRSHGWIAAGGAEGELGWIVDDGDPYYVWWVPVARWSSFETQ